VNVAFTQQDVGPALQFDLTPVLGFKKHPITNLNVTDVWPSRDNLGPGQASTHRRRRGDHDPPARAALTVSTIDLNQDSVLEEFDR